MDELIQEKEIGDMAIRNNVFGLARQLAEGTVYKETVATATGGAVTTKSLAEVSRELLIKLDEIDKLPEDVDLTIKHLAMSGLYSPAVEKMKVLFVIARENARRLDQAKNWAAIARASTNMTRDEALMAIEGILSGLDVGEAIEQANEGALRRKLVGSCDVCGRPATSSSKSMTLNVAETKRTGSEVWESGDTIFRGCDAHPVSLNITPARVRTRLTHHLKTLPEFFGALMDGRKTFEARKNDRDFEVGDLLCLEEWTPESGLSGRREFRHISYILKGQAFGIAEGYAVLGFEAP